MSTDKKTTKKTKVNKDMIEKMHGKVYYEKHQKIEKKEYPLAEAVKLLKTVASTKFDETCELHINLNADPKHADQTVRGQIILPNGTGKKVKIAAFVSEENVEKAKKAGAFKAGLETMIEEIKKGKIDFDIAVAEPAVMKTLAKVAKKLGQKGLMPNPKAGTVTPDIEKTIKEINKGKVEFKNDKNAIIHTIFGKMSFDAEKLIENAQTLLKAIIEARPSGIKGTYINSIAITATMSPSIRLNVNEAIAEAKK